MEDRAPEAIVTLAAVEMASERSGVRAINLNRRLDGAARVGQFRQRQLPKGLQRGSAFQAFLGGLFGEVARFPGVDEMPVAKKDQERETRGCMAHRARKDGKERAAPPARLGRTRRRMAAGL
jgi:hypothetical protein